MGFRAFLGSAAVTAVDFLVYKDLRDRGFYLAPAGDDRGADGPDTAASPVDFVVFPRGKGPWDDDVAFRIRAVSERAAVDAGTLLGLAQAERGDGSGVLAVVDEESELTYLELSAPTPSGSAHHDLPAGVAADLLSDRVLVADPPAAMHERAFYGQRLDQDAPPLQLSLVEAAYLAAAGTLSVEGGEEAVRDRGRAVEGDRFDRRLRVYTALRSAGVVPKTGFKFGADFRTYADVTDVSDLGHSELLVRVLPRDHAFSPRDLALDVRLAHGVRKRMVFALVDDGAVSWLSAERLTP
jgi:tRNA-intron endonuclease